MTIEIEEKEEKDGLELSKPSYKFPKKPLVYKGACPDCGGDVFDGTGCGYEICEKCHAMF